MTFALNLPDVCNSIAALSISGVTIKDRDEVVASWVGSPNILYPNVNPPGFVTGFRPEYVTNLRGLNAPSDIHYTLNYRFLGTQVGDLSTMSGAYSNVVDKMVLIIAAIMDAGTIYSGKVQIELGDISIGLKEDPVGNQYHGADFALVITEQH